MLTSMASSQPERAHHVLQQRLFFLVTLVRPGAGRQRVGHPLFVDRRHAIVAAPYVVAGARNSLGREGEVHVALAFNVDFLNLPENGDKSDGLRLWPKCCFFSGKKEGRGGPALTVNESFLQQSYSVKQLHWYKRCQSSSRQ